MCFVFILFVFFIGVVGFGGVLGVIRLFLGVGRGYFCCENFSCVRVLRKFVGLVGGILEFS